MKPPIPRALATQENYDLVDDKAVYVIMDVCRKIIKDKGLDVDEVERAMQNGHASSPEINAVGAVLTALLGLSALYLDYRFAIPNRHGLIVQQKDVGMKTMTVRDLAGAKVGDQLVTDIMHIVDQAIIKQLGRGMTLL